MGQIVEDYFPNLLTQVGLRLVTYYLSSLVTPLFSTLVELGRGACTSTLSRHGDYFNHIWLVVVLVKYRTVNSFSQ